jgi:hypothetical protein
MHHRIDRVSVKEAIEQRTHADVALNESMPLWVRQVFQVLQAAGVGQSIQVDDVHSRVRLK